MPPRNALATTKVKPFDPADLGFHPMLPVELAMRVAPVPEICAAYDVTKEQLTDLIANPVFAQAFANAQEMLQKDGMSFRIKARLQAEELLKKSWQMIHALETPTAVKADLIKSTVRWAGLEPKGDTAAGLGSAFQININLGG